MNKHIPHAIVSLLIIGSLTMCTTAGADVEGIVYKKDGGRLRGKIRWLPASKVYVVTDRVALQIPLAQVLRVEVKEPPELNNAIRMVRSGQYGAAVPVLENILKEYAMLEHDVTAARWLADSYLQGGDARRAIDMCRKVMQVNPRAVTAGDLTGVYWRALLEDGRDAVLKKELGEAIESGPRPVAATAQIIRGDIAVKDGEFRDALVDGYLRTVVLFQDVKTVQPEALYKAMKAFGELGQHSHAEKMRKRLLAEFPKDSYSQKARAGI